LRVRISGLSGQHTRKAVRRSRGRRSHGSPGNPGLVTNVVTTVQNTSEGWIIDTDKERVRAFNAKNIAEFRTSGGRISAFGDAPVLLLTTTGARSGQPRTNPMMYLADENDPDRVYVFASAAGADTNPAWFHNVVAHPQKTRNGTATRLSRSRGRLRGVRDRRGRPPCRSARALVRTRTPELCPVRSRIGA
jgi:deazaflavin-dependent oxidoreductase (nitroreductase family)